MSSPTEPKQLPSFVLGQTYIRKEDITGRYGGNGQSGIAQSRTNPVIFVFMGESGEHYGYSDSFDGRGWLTYTGAGRRGDMKLTGSNLAIATHAEDGRALHVFFNHGRGICEYKGEFAYVSHVLTRGPDSEGEDREVIQFHLMPAQSAMTTDQDLLVVDEESEETPLSIESPLLS